MQGMNGTIQHSKPVFEKIVGLGDTQPYIQRLRSESKESNVTFWVVLNNFDEVRGRLEQFYNEVGIKNYITIDGILPSYHVWLLDYTYTYKQGAEGRWLLSVDATLITAVNEDGDLPA